MMQNHITAQSVGTVEFADCISAEGYPHPPLSKKCPRYKNKPPDDETLVLKI